AKKYKKNGQPVIKDPLIRQKMVRLYTRFRASLLNYYRNLTHTLKTRYPGSESSVDKLAVRELNKEIARFAISIQGQRDMLWKEDASVESSWQERCLVSCGETIGGGTSEVQRNTIGKRVIGLPKDMGR